MSDTMLDHPGDDRDWSRLVDLAILENWLDVAGVGSGPLENVAQLAGGTQNILLAFDRDGEHYVLRRPPLFPQYDGNATIQREARFLTALRGSDVPHPPMIAACSDSQILGGSFYVMKRIEGFNAHNHLPQLHASSIAIRRAMGFSLIDGIIALGRVDPFAVGLGDVGRVGGYLDRQVPRWLRQLDDYREHDNWPGTEALPHRSTVADWLSAHKPESFTPGIVHGDYHLSNVMFRPDGPELAAIVDWELASVGDPLVDLGWVVATWPDPTGPVQGTVGAEPWTGFPTAAELVEHYGRRSGRDLSRIRWYVVLACFRLGILVEGTYARSLSGKADPIIGERLHSQAVFLFERAANLILGNRTLSTID